MAEVSYGHIAIVPKGVWSSETQYEVGHLVEHDGSSYVVKTRPPVGTLPTDESYWQLSAKGTTVATGNIAGVVKGSDDITVGENGELFVNTEFEQATELANLIAGEAIKSVLGKVSKAIAATMNLDQNALLKNMISGIDTNDGNKVPSSAFVHTLHERLGMGTALATGDASNVTQAINKLYSDLIVLNTKAKNMQRSYLGNLGNVASGSVTLPGLSRCKWLIIVPYGGQPSAPAIIVGGGIRFSGVATDANIASIYEVGFRITGDTLTFSFNKAYLVPGGTEFQMTFGDVYGIIE